MALFYANDYLLTLAYLMGERTVQTSTTASRTEFLNESLKDVYKYYKWPFATRNISLSVASGVASLPSTYDPQHGLDGYFYQGTSQTEMDYVNPQDAKYWQSGDKKYWTEAQENGTYLFKTKDTYISSFEGSFQCVAPSLGASQATPYPNKIALGLGARRYIKLSEDPNADISQDESLFQKKLTEDIAATQVGNPRKRTRKLNDANGHRTGGGF